MVLLQHRVGLQFNTGFLYGLVLMEVLRNGTIYLAGEKELLPVEITRDK